MLGSCHLALIMQGPRLRGKRKTYHGRKSQLQPPEVNNSSLVSSGLEENPPDHSFSSNSTSTIQRCDRLPHLQPITSFSSISGLSNVVLPSGVTASTNRDNILNNSAVIEILVHLLCRQHEPNNARRELLFIALCKVMKQWNGSLYLPLSSFSELRDFRTKQLRKFEFLIEEIQSQITTKPTKLIIPSFHLPSTGSPLTQLAFTDSYQHQFLDDRYSREFHEISVLGKGGFGVVVKAQNKLDGRMYAIKIIIMHKQDSETNTKLLREVQALAQLDHPNIVRYHSTWLQLFTVPAHLWPNNRGSPKLKKHHLEKIKMNKFFPASQVIPGVKIQELPSSSEPVESEESSGGIVFADVSKKNSSDFFISKNRKSRCDTVEESESSSGGIIFMDVSTNKSDEILISKNRKSRCDTVEESESSSGGIVFADVSKNKSDDFLISKNSKSRCDTVEESESSSGGIVFADVSKNKSNDFLISKNRKSRCATVEESEESSGVSRNKCNNFVSKNRIRCDTIDEIGESSYDSKLHVSIDNKQIALHRNSVLNHNNRKWDFKSTCMNNKSVCSRFGKSEFSEGLLTTDSSFSKFDIEVSSFSRNALISNDDIDDGVCKVKKIYSSTLSSDSSDHYKNKLMLCQKHPKASQMTLFIQMGLCGDTLAHWISKRNDLPVIQGKKNHVNRKVCLDLFRQILLAVQYIHSKKIIHRDLKPPNIFFTEDGNRIQLGDFGLARSLPAATPTEENGMDNSFCFTPFVNHTSNTGGVGTPIYAPPEFAVGGFYGSESDMHNLGIILLELFYPFQTGSERICVIGDLKTKRYLEPEFTRQWPDIAPLILKLTDQDQTKRPTASDVLKLKLFSEELLWDPVIENVGLHARSIFLTKGMEYKQSKELQNHFDNLRIASNFKILHAEEHTSIPQDKEKDEEIRKLRDENTKLQEMVAQLQEQINQSSAVKHHQATLKHS